MGTWEGNWGVRLEAWTLTYGEKHSVCSAGCVWGGDRDKPDTEGGKKKESEPTGLAAGTEHALMGESGWH